MAPLFPHIKVKLSSVAGNAFSVVAWTTSALRAGGATPGDIERFMAEAEDGDYDHLLRTVIKWVEVC